MTGIYKERTREKQSVCECERGKIEKDTKEKDTHIEIKGEKGQIREGEIARERERE